MNVIAPVDGRAPPDPDRSCETPVVDGRWIEAASGKTFETYNPSTGAVLAAVADGDCEDIRRAVAAAFPESWRAAPVTVGKLASSS